jgi:Tol biopolymer transport system component
MCKRLSLTAALVAVLVVPHSSARAAGVNGRIAFSSDRSGVFEIWTINPDGTGAKQLTYHGANIQDWWPVVSPDGRRIAFTRYDRTNKTLGSEALYIMNADGSGLQRLSNEGNTVDDNLADFSPDGLKVAFTSDRNDPNRLSNDCRRGVGILGCNWDVYVMNTDGTDQQRLTSDPAGDTYPEFSPDGSKILFASTRNGSSAVYTMDTDGTNVQQLTADSLGAGDANWSPDGTKITFVNNFCICSGNSDLFTMDADGTNVTQLTSNYGNNLEPGYSPDGREIVIAHFAPVSPTGGCCGNADVVVMNATDGSARTNITNMAPAIDSETPDWGPAPPLP